MKSIILNHWILCYIKNTKLFFIHKINPEIVEKKCGFGKGKGTTNVIYILLTIIEQVVEEQKEPH